MGHGPLLGLLTVPWNCLGASGCVISLADWGSMSSLGCHLGSIWFQSIYVVSLGYVILSKVVSLRLQSQSIPKGNQSWIFIGRTGPEAEASVFWPPDAKSQLIRKDADAGKDWRQEEKGMAEDELVGWHHRLNGHEFEWALAVGEGQGRLVCCSPWGQKEVDMTEQLNNNLGGMAGR